VFKRLLFLGIVAAAIWYGSKHYQTLMPSKSGDIEVVNHSGRGADRVRISSGGQTVVVEALEDGATTRIPFQPQRDGTFQVVWKPRGLMTEPTWSGGNASAGPDLRTYTFEFRENGDILWSTRPKM